MRQENLNRRYIYVLVAYLIMQLSSIIGVPLVILVGSLIGQSTTTMEQMAVPIWLLISFTLTFIIIIFILKKEWKTSERWSPSSIGSSISWAIAGVFLALFAQTIAANIEQAIGIEMGSENTENIIRLIEGFPFIILISSVIGPILEEIVFRKIIFGALYTKFNFFLSALISSVIFALAHFEPEHILLYSSMGFTFAFLYIKTKRIIVPIFAHVTMNTLVVLMQSVFYEDIEKWLKQSEQITSFIGGL